MITNVANNLTNESAYGYQLYFRIADDQHGAKWPESCAFFKLGKCGPSLDYNVAANVLYILN